MNEESESLFKDLRFWLAVGGMVILLALVVVLFWDLVLEHVVLPLYRFFILARFGIDSIPQVVYLTLLVITCAIIVLRVLVLSAESKASPDIRMEARPGAYPDEAGSRYRYWKNQLASVHRSKFGRDEFARNARRLILDIIAHQEHRRWDEIELNVYRGQLILPPLIDYVIRERVLQRSQTPVDDWAALFANLWRWLNRKPPEPDPVMEEHIQTIIQFIEERLEIIHNE